jgi:hypothetical protein
VLGRQLDFDNLHDLREGLALAKGWLELVFRHWDEIDDERRREMIAGALFGANRVAFVLDMMEGRDPDTLKSPQEAMADEFARLSHDTDAELNGHRGDVRHGGGRRTIR